MYKFLEHKIIFRSLFFILLALTCLASLYFAVNIPHLDDYDQTLGFLTRYENSHGWDRLLLIFSERNEHRTAIFRIISVLDYSIFGKINLIHIIAVINVFFIGIAVLIFKLFRQISTDNSHFIPVLLILAVPAWGFFNWSSAGATYGPTIFFSLLAIYLLTGNSNRSFYLALISAILAVMSSGGGFVIFLAAIPFFLKGSNRFQIIVWSLTFLVSLGLYFFGYEPVKSGDVTHAILSTPHVIGANTLVFFGSFLQALFGERYVWSILFGLAVLGATAWIWFKYKNRMAEHPMIWSGILLGLGFGILAALMRSDSGLGVTAAYRYRLYHILLPIFLYFFYLKYYPNKKLYLNWILAISIFLFGLRWEDNLGLLKTLNNKLNYGHYAFQVTGSSHYIPSKGKERIKSTLEKATSQGIYRLDKTSTLPGIRQNLHTVGKLLPIRVVKSKELDSDKHYALQGWAILKFSPSDHLKPWACLRAENGQKYYLETGPFTHTSSLIINADAGFTFVLDKEDARIPRGNYTLSIALRHPIKGIVAEQDLDLTVKMHQVTR